MSAAPAARPQIVHVVAIADNDVIGKDGHLPWRLKSELANFKKLTFGKPVIMGRKTYDSIARPLPGRTNIVITRDPAFNAPGVIVTRSLPDALAVAHGDALRRGVDDIAVIGGTEIFKQTLDAASRLEVSRIHLSPEGDTLFPAIDPQVWREVARESRMAGTGDDANFTVLTYLRR